MNLLLIVFTFLMMPTANSGEVAALNLEIQNDTIQPAVVDFEGLRPWLEKNDNTVYVVNFWATWCAPCVKELPYFEAVNREFEGENVKVLLVSLDFKKQIESKLLPFIKEKNLKSEVVVLLDPDTNAWIDKISPTWSGALPATLIYKNGERSFYERTFHSQNELNDIIKPFLNTKP